MKIRAHKLQREDGAPVDFVATKKMGGAIDARYLIMHYTASGSLASAADTLTVGKAPASAHIVIGREGEIVQLVPFNRVAWHAGVSRWHGLSGMNRYTIGIELENAGKLQRHGDGWISWFQRHYPAAEVLEATHPHGGPVAGWHRYTEAQLAAAVEVGAALVDHYGLRDVLGHEDISPGRKSDPGPAFPMANYRSAVLGRADDAPEDYATIADLNIRSGPGTNHDKLDASPLPVGTGLRLIERRGQWCAVEVLAGDGTPQSTGWVHGDYIRPA